MNLAPELDRRKKITPKVRERMIYWRSRGWTLRSIAKEYGVSEYAVRYNVQPLLRFRQNVKSARRLADKWKSDPSYRQLKKVARKESRLYVKHNGK